MAVANKVHKLGLHPVPPSICISSCKPKLVRYLSSYMYLQCVCRDAWLCETVHGTGCNPCLCTLFGTAISTYYFIFDFCE